MKIAIQLHGGEKDGHTEIIEPDGRPDFFFIHETKDDERIRSAKGPAQAVLAEKLSVLCYQFWKVMPKAEKPGGAEYWYTRCAKRDRKR